MRVTKKSNMLKRQRLLKESRRLRRIFNERALLVGPTGQAHSLTQPKRTVVGLKESFDKKNVLEHALAMLSDEIINFSYTMLSSASAEVTIGQINVTERELLEAVQQKVNFVCGGYCGAFEDISVSLLAEEDDFLTFEVVLY